MTQPTNDIHSQLTKLTAKLLDGSASKEELRTLEELLSGSADARRSYLRQTLLHAQLGLIAKETWRPDESIHPAGDTSILFSQLTASERPARRWTKRIISPLATGAVAAVLCLAVFAVWPVRQPPQMDVVDVEPVLPMIGYYDQSELPKTPVAVLQEDSPMPSDPGERTLSSSMTLQLNNGVAHIESLQGASIELRGPVLFGLASSDNGVLYGGSVRTRLNGTGSSYSVEASNLKVVDLGTEYEVTAVDDDLVAVEVIDGEVEIQARHRLPLYYWNFESPTTDQPDIVTGTVGTLGPAAKIVPGIIGQGAVEFNNTKQSFVAIQGGTGESVGTGRFACASGVTVEALFISNWTAEELDYDEIFRKEDGVCRIILSFQNDADRNDFSIPLLTRGPSLSFGLHLEGSGYSELEIPLDGQNGHPTLTEVTDGRPHHIVATYDSFSGRKAVYLDGKLQVEHRFAKGSMIRSGGPATAFIGNHAYHEPFRGVIDEVAYYDFALTAAEVRSHYEEVLAGNNYFRMSEEELKRPQWEIVTRLKQGGRQLFNRHTALPVVVGQSEPEDARLLVERSQNTIPSHISRLTSPISRSGSLNDGFLLKDFSHVSTFATMPGPQIRSTWSGFHLD